MATTNYAKQYEGTEPTTTRHLTIEEAQALPGLLGRIATAMLARHGAYGYTDFEGDTHLLKLVTDGMNGELALTSATPPVGRRSLFEVSLDDIRSGKVQ